MGLRGWVNARRERTTPPFSRGYTDADPWPGGRVMVTSAPITIPPLAAHAGRSPSGQHSNSLTSTNPSFLTMKVVEICGIEGTYDAWSPGAPMSSLGAAAHDDR